MKTGFMRMAAAMLACGAAGSLAASLCDPGYGGYEGQKVAFAPGWGKTVSYTGFVAGGDGLLGTLTIKAKEGKGKSSFYSGGWRYENLMTTANILLSATLVPARTGKKVVLKHSWWDNDYYLNETDGLCFSTSLCGAEKNAEYDLEQLDVDKDRMTGTLHSYGFHREQVADCMGFPYWQTVLENESWYKVYCARDVFAMKDKAATVMKTQVLKDWAGAVNVVRQLPDGTYDSFLAQLDKKGKVRISCVLPTGKKVSGKSYIYVDPDMQADGCGTHRVPVALPAAKLSCVLDLEKWRWNEEFYWGAYSNYEAYGKGDWFENGMVDGGRPGTLVEGVRFWVDAGALESLVRAQVKGAEMVFTDYLPDGLSVVQKGKDWIVADGAKPGKVVLRKDSEEVDEGKLTDNTSGLKLVYKAKDGSVKGSFKVYCLVNGRVKALTATVKGVLVNGYVYGTATIKKVGSVSVEIN